MMSLFKVSVIVNLQQPSLTATRSQKKYQHCIISTAEDPSYVQKVLQ